MKVSLTVQFALDSRSVIRVISVLLIALVQLIHGCGLR
jgi:hypothetical protein